MAPLGFGRWPRRRRGGGGHQANFIKAVRSRNSSDLTASILEAHLSSALCHIANISHRLGQEVLPEEISKEFKSNSLIHESFSRFQDHLFNNWVDLTNDLAVVGPWLDIDAKNETFVVRDKFDVSYWANQLIKDSYRKPFVIPEKI